MLNRENRNVLVKTTCSIAVFEISVHKFSDKQIQIVACVCNVYIMSGSQNENLYHQYQIYGIGGF